MIKFRHLGDVLLSSPLFSALKKRLPEATIDALVYKESVPMLEGHPAISSILSYDRSKKGLLQDLSLCRQVRKLGYDMVCNLTEGDRGAITALVSGAKIRVGFETKRKRGLTHIVKKCQTLRHTVERDLDVARRIGIFPENRDLTLFVPQSAREKVRHLLEEEGIPDSDFIVVHAVSRWRFKCPPPELIAKVIDDLIPLGMPILLTAAPIKEELEMVKSIAEKAKNRLVFNLGGKLHLKELSALVEKAKAVLTVDTVTLHIASALKTPVVALFGPTSEINWGPWRHPKAYVITSKASCRPCYMDGCGGSKMSDCLYSLCPSSISSALNSLIEQKIPF